MNTSAKTKTHASAADYVVKDIGLAEWGRKEIAIAETEMPGLMATREEFGPQQPLRGAERFECLDQNRSLDGHMQRASDPGAAQRLLWPEFVARCHQARHFGFGDGDLLTAPVRKTDVLDDIIGGRSMRLCFR